ncbi:hypothetical protein [Kurthia massiliensis]|uniref:hypothetical protein n=1 Tax=Kurthia massiliensis TaxID=1033739 RepID=UPI000287E926|nr:hypothetical protein [Kurthia massiliensis]
MPKKLNVSQQPNEYTLLIRSMQQEIMMLRQQNKELKKDIVQKDSQYIALEKFAMDEINTLQQQLTDVLIEKT